MAVQITPMRPITRRDPLAQALGYQESMAGVREKNAKAHMEEQKARFPFMGNGLTGPAAQAQSLEVVRAVYGDESPQYQLAKQQWDLNQARIQAEMKYKLTNLPLKNLTEGAKDVVIGEGFVPGTQGGTPVGGGGMPVGGVNPGQPNVAQNMGSPQGQGTPAQGMPNQNQVAPTPAPAQALTPLQRESQMRANKGVISEKMQTRFDAAQAFDEFKKSPEVQQGFQVMAKYGGIIPGKGKAWKDMITDPNEYAEFVSARDQLPTALAAGLAATEGWPATNKGIKAATNYFTAANKIWYTNPPAAAKLIEQGNALLDAEIRALGKVAQPIFEVKKVGQKEPAKRKAAVDPSKLSNEKLMERLNALSQGAS